MVKALFFDLTGTLQNFNWNRQWPLLKKLLESTLRTKVDIEAFKVNYQQVYEVYRLGWLKNDREFFDLLFKQLGWNVSKAQIQKIAKQHLKLRRKYTWLPKDYDKVLKELRKDFKLAIVTSGMKTWAEYDYKNFFGFNIGKHFDLQVWGQDHGYIKESGKLFDIALRKLKIKKKDVAFIGDHHEGDVLTAKKYGLKAVLLSTKKGGKEDLRIKSFNELLKIKNKLKKL